MVCKKATEGATDARGATVAVILYYFEVNDRRIWMFLWVYSLVADLLEAQLCHGCGKRNAVKDITANGN